MAKTPFKFKQIRFPAYRSPFPGFRKHVGRPKRRFIWPSQAIKRIK